MAVTIAPTTMTIASGGWGSFTASTVGYTGRFTASSADQTKCRVYAQGPISGASTGASKESFGPTGTFYVQNIATGGPVTVTVTDDAGTTGTCAVTTS